VDELVILNEVQFHGRHLGGASTFSQDRDRWIEIDIYRTVSGKYVAEVIGCSDVEGEVDFITTHEAGHAQQLIERMTYKGRLSKPSQDALEAASNNDPSLAAIYRVQTVRFID